MTRSQTFGLAAAVTVFAAAATVIGPSVAQASSRDRVKPSAPSRLRVEAAGPYSVTLAWDAANDNAGRVHYVVRSGAGVEETTAPAATSATFRTDLLPATRHSFTVSAVDVAGNRSESSNAVDVTLPEDLNPPTAPVLSVKSVGAGHISLSWTPSHDDGRYVSYQVLQEGGPALSAGGETAATVHMLRPETRYTFTVWGRDNWHNWSPVSNAVSVTTAASNPRDVTPPSKPENLSSLDLACSLLWAKSSDDLDPPGAIRYDVFVNGRLDHSVAGGDRTILRGSELDSRNKFRVVAVDTAGNRSPAAEITASLASCG